LARLSDRQRARRRLECETEIARLEGALRDTRRALEDKIAVACGEARADVTHFEARRGSLIAAAGWIGTLAKKLAVARRRLARYAAASPLNP
jgi:hypothetical protein